MAKFKVRCPGCGAMNSDALAERCRVCSTMLPNATRRRSDKLEAISAGPAFNEIVETEVAAWQEYAAGRSRPGAKSRRPTELDEPKPSKLPWRR
jgi:hypothetical protein